MKIPKKMLFEMVMTGKLQKLDRSTDKWIEFDFIFQLHLDHRANHLLHAICEYARAVRYWQFLTGFHCLVLPTLLFDRNECLRGNERNRK